MLRIGIIGGGTMASMYVDAIAGLPSASVAAIADLTRSGQRHSPPAAQARATIRITWHSFGPPVLMHASWRCPITRTPRLLSPSGRGYQRALRKTPGDHGRRLRLHVARCREFILKGHGQLRQPSSPGGTHPSRVSSGEALSGPYSSFRQKGMKSWPRPRPWRGRREPIPRGSWYPIS